MATVMGKGHRLAWKPTLLASALVAALTACGGGGGGGSSSNDDNNPSGPPDGTDTRESLSVRVVDGPIRNALVCLDLNANGLCDSGEPSATSDADGRAVLLAAPGQINQHAVVAQIGTDAVDRDHGPVRVPFTLSAPADAPALVSPLTTLVHAQTTLQQISTQEAAAFVQASLDLDVSPLEDFTNGSSTAAQQAGKAARLLVVTTQQQLADLAGATDADQKPLAAATIARAINGRLLQLLPVIATNVSDNLGDASPDASAYDNVAGLLAAEAGLTKDNVAAVIAGNAAATPDQAPGIGQAYRRLRWFRYAGNDNLEVRWIQATAAQNTPDTDGVRRYVEFREGIADGTPWQWQQGQTHAQVIWSDDLQQWRECGRLEEHTTKGQESLHCQAQRLHTTITASEDLTGKSILEVVARIRSYPLADAPGPFSSWGPDTNDPAIRAKLSGKTFPAGSELRFQTVRDVLNPETIDLESGRYARVPPPNDLENPNGDVWLRTSLSDFISHNSRGFALPVSEVHGNNSHVVVNRDYRKSNGDAAYKRYMVAFQASSATAGQARLFECEGDMYEWTQHNARRTLFIDGVSTCQVMGETTYAIHARGSRNVLYFAMQPAQWGTQDYLLIDRPGHETNPYARMGFRDKLKIRYQQRLNEAAAEALFDALDMPSS